MNEMTHRERFLHTLNYEPVDRRPLYLAGPLPANRFVIRIDTEGLHPGFYDLRVELDTGFANEERDRLLKRPVKGVSTFGWRVDEMPIAETRPADFRAFWDKGMADYAAIPLDARIESDINIGLIDPVSPAFGVWAAFNRLGSTDKTMVVLDGHGHDWSAEFDRRAWRWLDAGLAVPLRIQQVLNVGSEP